MWKIVLELIKWRFVVITLTHIYYLRYTYVRNIYCIGDLFWVSCLFYWISERSYRYPLITILNGQRKQWLFVCVEECATARKHKGGQAMVYGVVRPALYIQQTFSPLQKTRALFAHTLLHRDHCFRLLQHIIVVKLNGRKWNTVILKDYKLAQDLCVKYRLKLANSSSNKYFLHPFITSKKLYFSFIPPNRGLPACSHGKSATDYYIL